MRVPNEQPRSDLDNKHLSDFEYHPDDFDPSLSYQYRTRAPMMLWKLAIHTSGLDRDWPLDVVSARLDKIFGGGPPPPNGSLFPLHLALDRFRCQGKGA